MGVWVCAHVHGGCVGVDVCTCACLFLFARETTEFGAFFYKRSLLSPYMDWLLTISQVLSPR